MANPNDLALHVGYELDSMVRMALRIGANTDAVIENALLEATLLRCRNLIVFLVGPYRRDDITPEDFTTGWVPTTAGIPKGAVTAIHKHLAHLTKTRITDGKVGWEYPELVKTVLEAMRRSIEHCEACGGGSAVVTLRSHLRVADETIRQTAYCRPSQTTTSEVVATTTSYDVLSLGDFR